MRLIDADALVIDFYDDYETKDDEYTYAYVSEVQIDSAPSIEIVRCSECKYASDDGTYGCMCEHFNDTSDAYHRMWSDDFCSRGERNSSEKPNNCEHITEDGVTCARYPACDDCPDNPLNKVKGSERLVKGSEQTDCQTCKWWSSYGYCVHRECKGYESHTERSNK